MPATIVGGRIEKGCTQINGGMDGPDGLVIIDYTPASRIAGKIPDSANGPTAHAYRADFDIAASEFSFHVIFSLITRSADQP